MKNIEMGYQPSHTGLTFPFSSADCFDENPSSGLGHGMASRVNAPPPWYVSSSSGTNSGAHMVPSESFLSLPSSHPETSYNAAKGLGMPLNDRHWIHHFQNAALSDGYMNWCGSSDVKCSVMPPYGGVNAGSTLVLDSSRGELVNAFSMTPKEILEAKALAASRSHSEAERRRRERINSHLATLRTIIPGSTKSDKASLLAEVIDQVKRLKHRVSEVYQYDTMPSESDELVVETDRAASGKGTVTLRATICCDDRPDLMSDFKHALDRLELRMVKVEMSTLGGRIRNHFIVAPKDGACTEQDADILARRVQEALKLVLERPGGGELLSEGKPSKRQRLGPLEGQPDQN